ncbi:glycosyltransferase family 2 protein [Ramlibacter tataouinensis]|uniref:Candidate b-glycosyltransferase, Glycosyltransferase Family 2 n=1 Tax=Ramlibacter tataouinensis (strain ATCC BAA-407 / DSM 14655 / LMG 21543 / TTB310) TaxID=365046 RepID=F5XYX4_RAMTT|nr:glycosyltransferase family 2 protein [Ramlibacter tataouinensis]AEG91962.1 candidate b-glycosyltransferase, Glycosyltransferase Family 2 [Ramlibacter tataouinensis TTB310]
MAASSTPLSAGIAMCVYNGARFLSKQLESIAAQTILPTRMVVLDDGSTDGSWELLQAWAAAAPFPVDVERNQEKLGVVRNFERAATRLDTDIVFLADQDDLWYPEKVRTFLQAFTANPGLWLLHSEADLIDGDGRPLGRRLFDTLLVTAQERALVAAGEAWRVYAKRNLVTGAAAACRRELLARATPFSPRWVHDEWLAFVAALAGRVAMLDLPTMAYRLHGGNTVGLPVPTLGWRVRSTVKAFTEPTSPRQLARAERLEEIRALARQIGAAPQVLQHLERAAAHARFRAELPRNPVVRLARIWTERRAGHYHAWSNGPVSMLHDLLIAR